jgi:hypothetical protein
MMPENWVLVPHEFRGRVRMRGAAQMGPGDAARLLIATAGSDFVKDSVATLDGFGALLPVSPGRPPRQVTFLDHLTGLLGEIAAMPHGREERELSDSSNVAFRLMSAACTDPKRFPRFAISKWGNGPSAALRFGALRFAAPGLEARMRDESDFAMYLRGKGSGLIRIKMVTIDALSTIADSL